MSDRAKYWAGLVAEWERSGQSQVEFCNRRGLKVVTFAWWKRRLQIPSQDMPKRRGRPPKVSNRFIEVRLPGPSSSLPGMSSASGYEVVLASGRSIRVPAQFDPQILSRLITAVESC